MTTYVCKAITSDLDINPIGFFSNEMSVGVGTNGSVDVDGSPGGATAGYFITPSGVPNSDDWEDGGTWELEIEVDVANMSMDMAVRCVRFDPDKLPVSTTPIQVGAETAKQSLTKSRVFNPVAPTWDAPDQCRYRLGFKLIVYAASDQVATIGLGTVANEGTADITEDNCGGTPAGPGLRMAGDYGPRIIVPPMRVVGF